MKIMCYNIFIRNQEECHEEAHRCSPTSATARGRACCRRRFVLSWVAADRHSATKKRGGCPAPQINCWTCFAHLHDEAGWAEPFYRRLGLGPGECIRPSGVVSPCQLRAVHRPGRSCGWRASPGSISKTTSTKRPAFSMQPTSTPPRKLGLGQCGVRDLRRL